VEFCLGLARSHRWRPLSHQRFKRLKARLIIDNNNSVKELGHDLTGTVGEGRNFGSDCEASSEAIASSSSVGDISKVAPPRSDASESVNLSIVTSENRCEAN